jgi:hypothetical protein
MHLSKRKNAGPRFSDRQRRNAARDTPSSFAACASVATKD